MTRIRGSVMLETALFVSAALLFMLGTMQIGGLGFLQLTSDGAAYFDARANVLAVTSGTAETATHKAFDQIPAADIQPTAIPAPTPTVPVDYGYNSSNSTELGASAVNRHGGASMLQPVQEQSTVAVPGLMHVLGQSLGVNGTAIEAKWLECDPHFDVANAASCSQSNPSSTQQTDYFSNGEHTPPYFVGFNYLQQCAMGSQGPWGIYTGGNSGSVYVPKYGIPFVSFNTAGTTSPTTAWQGPCSSGQNYNDSNIEFIALGSAEYLDSANWQDSSPGASGACDTSKQPNPGTAQGVFEAAAFHQREFAIIGEFLSYSLQNGGLFMVEENSYEADKKINGQSLLGHYCGPGCGLGGYGGTGSAIAGNISTPEQVDTFANVTNSSGPYAATVAPGYSGSSFTSPGWEGFDTAAHNPATDDYYNLAVQRVYSWDRPIGQGQPPSDPTYNNPTYPEFGCS